VTDAQQESAPISPLPLAADLRSADNRDCPSRTDYLGAALAEVAGGPVGRHALIGRTRVMTPVRVMFLMALVFLALGWSTKAACLQSTGTGTGDQRVANWDNQRAYYELCYSDTVPLYGAELLSQGKFPYKASWVEKDADGKPQTRYDGRPAVRYMEYPVLTGVYQYISMALAKTYTAVGKLIGLPVIAEVVIFFDVAALGLALHYAIVIVAAALFFAVARRWAWLREEPVTAGLAYGVAIYVFMNFVVLPLSAYPFPLRFPLLTTATGLLVHMVGVGLPISLITRRAHS